jgi:Acetoacetate decarboxylase (ADC)
MLLMNLRKKGNWGHDEFGKGQARSRCRRLDFRLRIVTRKESAMIKFARAILLSILIFFFYGCATESEEVITRPSRPFVPHIYLEKEHIFAYFEVANLNEYKKLIPNIFSMPERPLCRVSIVDFYKMEAGPPYLESTIDILVKYKKPQGEKEILAWYFLEVPVTTENALWGRFVSGFPKVLRKVTFERYENKYVGTSYGRDGKTPALKLALELRKDEPSPDEKSFLDFILPFPSFTIKDGKVRNWGVLGGGKYKIYQLEKVAPQIWNIKFGDCSIEYPNDPKNYLYRLGIGKFITGYWLKMKYRYSLKYTEG